MQDVCLKAPAVNEPTVNDFPGLSFSFNIDMVFFALSVLVHR